MSLTGLLLGFAVAQGKDLSPPETTRIALVSALPRSPVLGLVLASALANKDVSTPSPAPAGSTGGTTGTGGSSSGGSTGPSGGAIPISTATQLKVTAKARVHEVELSWTPPQQAANVSYTLYRLNYEKNAQDPEKVIGPVQVTRYEDEQLPPDTPYLYIVQAMVPSSDTVLGTGWVATRTQLVSKKVQVA